MNRIARAALTLAAALLTVACGSRELIVSAPRCAEGEAGRFASEIRGRAAATADSADCVLYTVEDGRLLWRALHPDGDGTYPSGVLVDPAAYGMTAVTAVAAGTEEVFFLYRDADAGACRLGRVDLYGRVERNLCADLPTDAVRLMVSAGDCFCVDAAGCGCRLGNAAEPLPVGDVWALTADAIIFVRDGSLRACLREDYETITTLATLPAGGKITAIAIDQATEEETRIYMLCDRAGGGQVISFSDGGWQTHGAPKPGLSPDRFAAVSGGCVVADSESLWYLDAAAGVWQRLGDAGGFVIAEDEVCWVNTD